MDYIANNSGVITTVVFFTVFVLVAVWAYLPANKTKLNDHAMIPLQEHDE